MHASQTTHVDTVETPPLAATSPMVDATFAALIEVAAAVAANCEPCLRQTIGRLRHAGVPIEHVQAAAHIGEVVKEKPALVMKEAADVLAGTELIKSTEKGACPAESMAQGEELLRVLLISVGAAMGANCERCLNKAVPALLEAGADEEDIRKAVEIGQLVKDEASAFVRTTTAMLMV